MRTSTKNLDKPLEHEDGWHLLFAIEGLRITDPESNEGRSPWGDATVISLDHVEKLIRKAGLEGEDRALNCFGCVGDVTFGNRGTKGEKPSGYILVRGRTEWKGDDPPDIPSHVDERARNVEAGLSLALLTNEFISPTCAMLRHARSPIAPTGGVHLQKPSFFTYWGGGSTTILSTKNRVLEIDYEGLFARQAKSPFRATSSIMLNPRHSNEAQLYDWIRYAGLRWVAACFTPDADIQALGAVTSLELILGMDNPGFDRIRDRAAVIATGIPNSESDLKWLFNARHDFVHRGSRVEETILHRSAILVMKIIERVARSTGTLRTRPALCAFLDRQIADINLSSVINCSAGGLPLNAVRWEDLQ